MDRVKLEKTITLVLKGANINDYDLFGEKRDYIKKIIVDPRSLEKKRFKQIFVETDFSKKTYEGVILEVKFKKNMWKVTLIYGDTSDLDKDEYMFSLAQLLADFTLGDLDFL